MQRRHFAYGLHFWTITTAHLFPLLRLETA